jgi:hypothetical protein
MLSNWTYNEISLKFNFSNPKIISKGLKKDKIFIRPIDPEIIRSDETGEPLDISSRLLVSVVPT